MSAPQHLDEFIKGAKNSLKRNAYVLFPGFKFLYVRYSTRYINKEFAHPVIDLANLEAEKPGNGAFRELVRHIQNKYPECWIYVESVLNPRFAETLVKRGFTPQHIGFGECYYLEPLLKTCPICKKSSVLVSSLVGGICPECAALPRKDIG